jgi:hypothetical protein
MALIPGTLLRRLAIGLAGGLAALPLVCAGNDAALAQPAGAAWNAGAAATAPQLPPPLPQQLPPQAGTLTPMCCVTAAPPATVAPPAAPAVAAPAVAPSRRN